MPAASVRTADTAALTASNGELSNSRIRLTLDAEAGGVSSLILDGVEYAGRSAENLRFGVPVLETATAGTRDDIFVIRDIESPDWFSGWNRDWTARRDAPAKADETREVVASGRAEISQSFSLANGDKVDVHYRLVPGEPAVEIEAVVHKQPLASPHGIYLPMPVALSDKWHTHFETGGAAVKLDDEQLPYASRHYITTQRWLRIADEKSELTLACPDAPLWQVGGYTFGRFGDPDGRVERTAPVLLAWLTNNYWMTNFQADQAGRLRFRFHLIPHAVRSLGESIRAAIPHAHPLAAHLFAERGPVKAAAASLLTTELGPLILTRLEAEDSGVALTLLNPEDEAREARIGSGTLTIRRAVRTSLSGEPLETLGTDAGVRVRVDPRAWTRIALYPG
jgi:hypothetical protein